MLHRIVSAFALAAAMGSALPSDIANADENSYPRIEGDYDNQRTVYAPGHLYSGQGNIVGGGEARFEGSLEGRPSFSYAGMPRVQENTGPRHDTFKVGESSNG